MRAKRAMGDEAIEGFVGGAAMDLVVMVEAERGCGGEVGAIGAKRRGGRGLTGLTFMAVLVGRSSG